MSRAPAGLRGSRRSPPSAPPGTAPRSGSRAPAAPATHGHVTAAATGTARSPRPRPPRATRPWSRRSCGPSRYRTWSPNRPTKMLSVKKQAQPRNGRPADMFPAGQRVPVRPSKGSASVRGRARRQIPYRGKNEKRRNSPVLPSLALVGFVPCVTPPPPGPAARPLPRSPHGSARSGSGRRRLFADGP